MWFQYHFITLSHLMIYCYVDLQKEGCRFKVISLITLCSPWKSVFFSKKKKSCSVLWSECSREIFPTLNLPTPELRMCGGEGRSSCWPSQLDEKSSVWGCSLAVDWILSFFFSSPKTCPKRQLAVFYKLPRQLTSSGSLDIVQYSQ